MCFYKEGILKARGYICHYPKQIEMKLIITVFVSMLISVGAIAQLSNAQLIAIKDDADDGKALWMKYFEEGYANKNMNELPALRGTFEKFLLDNISRLSRMNAEGDARELLTAVKNYLVIEKQFVKDVMVPAESLKPGDDDTYQMLTRKMNESANKEKAFLIDIDNAIRSSPEPIITEPTEPEEPEHAEVSDKDSEEVKEEKPHRKEKLPHEVYDEGKKT